MAHFSRFARSLAVLAELAASVLLTCACKSGGSDEPARDVSSDYEPIAVCAPDQVRESFCDDLLPLSSSRPAPEPYDNCPDTTDVREGAYRPVSRLAVFDRATTAYQRKRVQPGHSCCYGWCAAVTLADSTAAMPATCRGPNKLQEGFCMRELEAGTSAPAASPFERCPAAVKPPDVVAFAAPSAVLLDAQKTAKRRHDLLLADCCYSWCSVAPSGAFVKETPRKPPRP